MEMIIEPLSKGCLRDQRRITLKALSPVPGTEWTHVNWYYRSTCLVFHKQVVLHVLTVTFPKGFFPQHFVKYTDLALVSHFTLSFFIHQPGKQSSLFPLWSLLGWDARCLREKFKAHTGAREPQSLTWRRPTHWPHEHLTKVDNSQLSQLKSTWAFTELTA